MQHNRREAEGAFHGWRGAPPAPSATPTHSPTQAWSTHLPTHSAATHTHPPRGATPTHPGVPPPPHLELADHLRLASWLDPGKDLLQGNPHGRGHGGGSGGGVAGQHERPQAQPLERRDCGREGRGRRFIGGLPCLVGWFAGWGDQGGVRPGCGCGRRSGAVEREGWPRAAGVPPPAPTHPAPSPQPHHITPHLWLRHLAAAHPQSQCCQQACHQAPHGRGCALA